MSLDGNTNQNERALSELESMLRDLTSQVGAPLQLPAVGLVLELESRRDSQTSQFKHLHQVTFLHREHFNRTNAIKLLYLMDAYLQLARAENGLGLYSIARSAFELSAFMHEVKIRLDDATVIARTDWVGGGQKFFGTVVRARFATTRDDYLSVLLEAGVPKDRLKPINVTGCIRNLAEEPDHSDAQVRYAYLCDFVHHNLASGTAATAGSTMSDVAVAGTGGGAFVMPSAGPILQYEYPIKGSLEKALEDTSSGFVRDVKSCIKWANETPSSPYSPEMIERFTGSPLGLRIGVPVESGAITIRVGRNDPCFCGSGQKYKRCHGSATGPASPSKGAH